jgi:hypothetical protein
LIAFVIYLLIISGLIYYNGFFKIFTDDSVSRKKFATIFLFKALAVPVFYIVYQRIYGGIENFDTGKYYHDAAVINDFAKKDFPSYLRLLFGLQNDSANSYDYMAYLSNTVNWDNGQMKTYFYNDNRIVIRLHSLFHFIAFKSWFVHALFNCFLSFIGISRLYKAFKEFFAGKELWVVLVLCFFPALWFYTGALLKEGITLFVMGCTVYQLKRGIERVLSVRGWIWLLALCSFSILLKPYLLVFSFVYFGLFFLIYRTQKIKHKTIFLMLGVTVVTIMMNLASVTIKHKSMFKAATHHRTVFADVANGGIFLLDSKKFVRVEFDTNLVIRVKPDIYRIKLNVPFYYWEHRHQQDTLYCRANKDTVTEYKLVYQIPESRSNINIEQHKADNPAKMIFSNLYYGLAHPMFFNAKGAVQLAASFENLLLLATLIFVCIKLAVRKKERYVPLAFLFFALVLCLIVGYAAPNSGAIFRYRSPAVVFILLAALYYLDPPRSKEEIEI